MPWLLQRLIQAAHCSCPATEPPAQQVCRHCLQLLLAADDREEPKQPTGLEIWCNTCSNMSHTAAGPLGAAVPHPEASLPPRKGCGDYR